MHSSWWLFIASLAITDSAKEEGFRQFGKEVILELLNANGDAAE
jgi:hypothetical protein